MQNITYKIETEHRTGRFMGIMTPVVCITILLAGVARGDDWMTWASTYTHEPVQGQRLDQYSQPVQPLAQRDPTFQRSGYRNYRSTLQGGDSADNMHIVEQWGAPVVPYEQWRFPFRPYGTPYDAWGPQAPYGISNSNFNANIGNPGVYPPHGYHQPGGSMPHPGHQPGQPPAGAGPLPNPHPGYGHPGYGYPGFANPGFPNAGSNQGFPNPGYNVTPNASNGFPLSPPYQNQPWFDGGYPVAPPLDNRSDAEFFWNPRR